LSLPVALTAHRKSPNSTPTTPAFWEIQDLQSACGRRERRSRFQNGNKHKGRSRRMASAVSVMPRMRSREDPGIREVRMEVNGGFRPVFAFQGCLAGSQIRSDRGAIVTVFRWLSFDDRNQ
jgi:hypothetical protein